MADLRPVRYEVEIMGFTDPFEWKLYRAIPGGSRNLVMGDDARGQSSTYDGAITLAREAAQTLHHKWLQEKSKNVEPVFEGNPLPPEEMRDALLEAQAKAWAVDEFGDLPVTGEKSRNPASELNPADFAD